jgi:hypothetical protein
MSLPENQEVLMFRLRRLSAAGNRLRSGQHPDLMKRREQLREYFYRRQAALETLALRPENFAPATAFEALASGRCFGSVLPIDVRRYLARFCVTAMKMPKSGGEPLFCNRTCRIDVYKNQMFVSSSAMLSGGYNRLIRNPITRRWLLVDTVDNFDETGLDDKVPFSQHFYIDPSTDELVQDDYDKFTAVPGEVVLDFHRSGHSKVAGSYMVPATSWWDRPRDAGLHTHFSQFSLVGSFRDFDYRNKATGSGHIVSTLTPAEHFYLVFPLRGLRFVLNVSDLADAYDIRANKATRNVPRLCLEATSDTGRYSIISFCFYSTSVRYEVRYDSEVYVVFHSDGSLVRIPLRTSSPTYCLFCSLHGAHLSICNSNDKSFLADMQEYWLDL